MSMRHPLCSLVVFFSLSLISSVAFGNDAEYGSYSGMPVPIENDSIRMVSENIIFTDTAKGGWRVDATYVFENTTKEKVNLKMGYPETEGDNSGVYFKGLETWVDGKKVKITTKTSGQMKEPWKGYRLGKVHLFDVAIEPSQKQEVKHTFEMAGGGSVALACEQEISYITRTGRLWKGPIGNARFEVSLLGAFDAYTISKGYDVKSIKHEVVRKGERSRTNIVFEMKDWMPEEDFRFVMMSECGEEGGMDKFYTGVSCPYWAASELVDARVKTLATKSKLSDEEKKKRQEAESSFLKSYSKSDLRLCRNYVYARYGYPFKSKDLREKFYGREPGAKHIYPPHYCMKEKGKEMMEFCRQERLIFFAEDKSFSPNLMTPYELMYVKMLLEEEKRRKK